MWSLFFRKRQVLDRHRDVFTEVFSYRRICAAPGEEFQGYQTDRTGSFIRLDKIVPQYALDKLPDFGWKIHISIDDSDNTLGEVTSNLQRAWDRVVLPLVAKYSLGSLKVLQSGEQMPRGNAGKQVTIYLFVDDRTSSEWQEILQELTAELALAGIRPGFRPHTDRPIQGSNYLSYWNDDAGSGEYANPNDYRDSDVDCVYNPGNFPDPLETILVNVPEQPAALQQFRLELGGPSSEL